MKKLLPIAVLLFCFAPMAVSSINSPNAESHDFDLYAHGSGKVYICTGEGARKYHSNSGCRGLNRCSASIISVSLKDAQKRGLDACKICYR